MYLIVLRFLIKFRGIVWIKLLLVVILIMVVGLLIVLKRVLFCVDQVSEEILFVMFVIFLLLMVVW